MPNRTTPTPGASARWLPVSPSNPCPACSKPDWCAWTPDRQTLRCMRGAGSTPKGMHLAGQDREGGTLYQLTAAPHRAHLGPKGAPQPPGGAASKQPASGTISAPAQQYLQALDQRFQAAITTDQLEALARQLGVTVSALQKVHCGWATQEDLRLLGAGGAGWDSYRPDGAYSFPERNGAGRLVGFSFRAESGQKGAPSSKYSCRRGLIVPAGLHHLGQPVLVVEGASDVAACLVLGLAAVGRPSKGPGGSGQLDVLDGGKVQVASTLTVWGQGTVHLDDGTITVGSGPLESDPNTLRIRQDGTLAGNGHIEGDIVNEGTVSPGTSFGILQVTGQYIQLPTGSLQIELGGLSRGASYDAIDLTSAVGLDGLLKIGLADGYHPTFEDTFQILTSESRGGTFSSIQGKSLRDGLVLRPFYGSTDVVLEVVLNGDANGDGAVGAADYSLWAAAFGQTGENLAADFDFNGEVGAADYAIWAANFGRVVSTISSSTSVPEPTGFPLAAVGMGMMVIYHRTRRRSSPMRA